MSQTWTEGKETRRKCYVTAQKKISLLWKVKRYRFLHQSESQQAGKDQQRRLNHELHWYIDIDTPTEIFGKKSTIEGG